MSTICQYVDKSVNQHVNEIVKRNVNRNVSREPNVGHTTILEMKTIRK